jgi:alpha-ketoglutarate-dependent taurine dioxygenase
MEHTQVVEAVRTLPYVVDAEQSPGVSPGSGAAGLGAYYEMHAADLDRQLLTHGAVLFRGFGVDTPEAFAAVANTLFPRAMEGLEENVPRTRLSPGVYTSTEFPAEYMLSMHSEYSYSHLYPGKLLFCCTIPPETGGETPLADNREVLRRLRPDVVEAFTRRRVTYIRNLHGGRGFGLSWQTSFQTQDRTVVEEYCGQASVEYEWKNDGGVRLVQTAPGIIRHPVTGELVWFNQAPQFHVSDYPEETYQDMMALFSGREADMSQDVRFEDGTPMDVAMLQHIRQTMHECAVRFPWRKGDVIMVDNVLVSHGRMPFTGPRKVLVAMSRG